MEQRKTKIIATLGPATSGAKVLQQMITAGMDAARLNMSHGNHTEKSKVLKRLRQLTKKQHKPIPVFADLQGPKMRIGRTEPPEGITFPSGITVSIAKSPIVTSQTIGIDEPAVVKALRAGDLILLADGTITLKIKSAGSRGIKAEVIQGGHLTSRKGFSVCGRSFNIPPFTRKDQEDLAWAITAGVDAIAISFVDDASTINTVRRFMKKHGANLPIIAKIERLTAVKNISSIIAAADALMVARGDLGVEAGSARVPILQKDIIRRSVAAGKPVITATEMIESMVTGNRPTRAESSDVANAVFDGTDAVMLSGETARGKHPAKVITAMAQIIDIAEANIHLYGRPQFIPEMSADDLMATMAEAMRRISSELDLSIVVLADSDRPVRLVSRCRPNDSIYAFVPPATTRWLNLIRGVIPISVSQRLRQHNQRRRLVVAEMKTRKLIRNGELVLILDTIDTGSGAILQLKVVS